MQKPQSKRSLAFKHYLYQLSLYSFIAITIWIGFEIYFSYRKGTEFAQINRDIEPISPELHLDLAQKLKNRVTPDSQQLEVFKSNLNTSATQSQIITLNPTSIATDSSTSTP